MSKNHKQVCKGYKLIWSICFCFCFCCCLCLNFAFAYLVGFPIGIKSSAVGTKIINLVKLFIIVSYQKKRKKHDHIVLLAETELNSVEILIFKALINWYINHDKYVSVNTHFFITKPFFAWASIFLV